MKSLQMPHRVGIVASLVLLAIGTAFGGFFGRYQGNLYSALEQSIIAHASIHRLSGDLEQDRTVIGKARRNFRGKLVRFHNHANGLALAIFVVSLVIANMEVSLKIKKLITWAISLAGVTYPFGWLVTGISIGTLGVDKAQKAGELILVPSGTIIIVCVVTTLAMYLVKEFRGRSVPGKPSELSLSGQQQQHRNARMSNGGTKEHYRRRTRTFGIALALGLVLHAGGAAAQTLWDDPAFALYQQAAKAFNVKDYEQAEPLARRAIEDFPNHILAYYLLGHIAMAQQKWDEAIQALSKVVALYPKSFAGHRDLGVSLARAGRTDEAIASYEKALKIRPGADEVKTRLAFLYLQAEKTEQAFSLFKELAEYETVHPEIWHALGRLYYDRKAYVESEKALRQASSLSGNHGSIWFDLGAVRLKLKDYQGAAQAFEQAAKDAELRERAYREAGKIYEYYLSDMTKANQYYERAQRATENAR